MYVWFLLPTYPNFFNPTLNIKMETHDFHVRCITTANMIKRDLFVLVFLSFSVYLTHDGNLVGPARPPNLSKSPFKFHFELPDVYTSIYTPQSLLSTPQYEPRLHVIKQTIYRCNLSNNRLEYVLKFSDQNILVSDPNLGIYYWLCHSSKITCMGKPFRPSSYFMALS